MAFLRRDAPIFVPTMPHYEVAGCKEEPIGDRLIQQLADAMIQPSRPAALQIRPPPTTTRRRLPALGLFCPMCSQGKSCVFHQPSTSPTGHVTEDHAQHSSNVVKKTPLPAPAVPQGSGPSFGKVSIFGTNPGQHLQQFFAAKPLRPPGLPCPGCGMFGDGPCACDLYDIASSEASRPPSRDDYSQLPLVDFEDASTEAPTSETSEISMCRKGKGKGYGPLKGKGKGSSKAWQRPHAKMAK
eukprot:TRINITY_DN41209_c0_g1_i1.p1 TRINITY_DN41209_c0_g1~~TRINITY_DN41209_c0_g1_i1.p1  ORF type:complete len:241 (+),score=54.50 TRINITY_DN41209_c0_g1_i1:55-777(+)